MIADCETCERKQVPCKSCEESQRAICYICQGDVADPYGELAVNVSHGFHVFRDGASWCAVGPHFIDLMKSDAAFGDTPEEATSGLREILANQRFWQNKPALTIEDFIVHDASSLE